MQVGLVGNGRIASRHIEALAGSQLRITDIAEVQPQRRLLKDEPNHKVRFHPDVKTMLSSNPNLGLVSILVESGKHSDIAREILPYKIPTLIEKPLTLSYVDARKLTEEFEENGVPLFVVKQNRLNPAVRFLLTEIDNGNLGRVNFAVASVLWCRPESYYFLDEWRLSRQLDGGVIWNQASHYVDLLVNLLGDIDFVSAFGNNYLSPAATEDTIFATLQSKSGALGAIQASTSVRPNNFEGSLTVSGDRALIRVGGHALNRISAYTSQDTKVVEDPEYQNSVELTGDVYGSSHRALYDDIHYDLMNLTTSQFRASRGLEVVATMEAITLSVMEKRIVSLGEIKSAKR